VGLRERERLKCVCIYIYGVHPSIYSYCATLKDLSKHSSGISVSKYLQHFETQHSSQEAFRFFRMCFLVSEKKKPYVCVCGKSMPQIHVWKNLLKVGIIFHDPRTVTDIRTRTMIPQKFLELDYFS